MVNKLGYPWSEEARWWWERVREAEAVERARRDAAAMRRIAQALADLLRERGAVEVRVTAKPFSASWKNLDADVWELWDEAMARAFPRRALDPHA